jgi:hypothetical protein
LYGWKVVTGAIGDGLWRGVRYDRRFSSRIDIAHSLPIGPSSVEVNPYTYLSRLLDLSGHY